MAMSSRAEGQARVLRIVSAVLLGATLVYLGLVGGELVRQIHEWPILHQERDFPSYYVAARRLLRGEDPYSGLREEARQLGIEDYFIDAAVTPPTFFLVTAWLALFPYGVAWGVWQILSLAALVISLLLAVRELRLSLPPPGWIILSCGVLLFPPLAFHMLYAHTELFLLFFLTASWALLRRGKEVPAGVLLGLAGAVRLYPLFLIVYLAQRRAWRGVIAALGSGLGLAALAALVSGPAAYGQYVDVMRGVVSTLYNRLHNLSLWGSTHKAASIWPALDQSPVARDGLAALLSLGILTLTVCLTRKPGASPAHLDREYGLFIVAALLASPLSWIYYQVLLYLPLLSLLSVLQQRSYARALPWILGLAVAAAFAPLVGGIPGLSSFWQRVLAFLPTLTLAGALVALMMAVPAQGDSGLAAGHDGRC